MTKTDSSGSSKPPVIKTVEQEFPEQNIAEEILNLSKDQVNLLNQYIKVKQNGQ